MKRLLLILIFLFPIITLVIWVYFGMAKSGKPPTAPASTTAPVVQTNSNSAPAVH